MREAEWKGVGEGRFHLYRWRTMKTCTHRSAMRTFPIRRINRFAGGCTSINKGSWRIDKCSNKDVGRRERKTPKPCAANRQVKRVSERDESENENENEDENEQHEFVIAVAWFCGVHILSISCTLSIGLQEPRSRWTWHTVSRSRGASAAKPRNTSRRE